MTRIVTRLAPLFLLFACVSLAQSLTPAVTASIGAQPFQQNGASSTVDLKEHFEYAGVAGKIARFQTVLGTFDVELLSSAAPNHVTNFLTYSAAANYDNTIIHRSAVFSGPGPAIVQGGGYTSTIPVGNVTARSPVNLEYNLPNSRGTLAAARGSSVNSATSEWYFNVTDNSTTLNTSNGGGYTVFGRVIGTGMTVVDAIAAVTVYNAGSPFDNIPLRNYTNTQSVAVANFVTISKIFEVPEYPATPGQAAALTFTATSSDESVATVAVSGSTLTVTPLSAGSATITVTAKDVRATAVSQQMVVTVNGPPVVISQHPLSTTVAPGSSVTLSVAASADTALSYQWMFGTTALGGATQSTLTLPNLTSIQSGRYWVAVSDLQGNTVSSRDAYVLVATPKLGGIINESVRTSVGPDSPLTVGFVLDGGSKSMLVRAVGPTLDHYGVPDVLPKPRLELNRIVLGEGELLESNSGWNGDANIASAASKVGAFTLLSNDDAAILRTLVASPHTAVASSANTASGAVNVEAYAVDGGGANEGKLLNLSARKRLDEANPSLTAGFSLSGNVPQRVLIRAVGPSLAPYLNGAELGDPTLTLNRLIGANGETVGEVLTNDDYASEGNVAEIVTVAATVGAFPLVENAADSAVLLTLPAGNYTVQVERKGSATGDVLIEVYAAP